MPPMMEPNSPPQVGFALGIASGGDGFVLDEGAEAEGAVGRCPPPGTGFGFVLRLAAGRFCEEDIASQSVA